MCTGAAGDPVGEARLQPFPCCACAILVQGGRNTDHAFTTTFRCCATRAMIGPLVRQTEFNE